MDTKSGRSRAEVGQRFCPTTCTVNASARNHSLTSRAEVGQNPFCQTTCIARVCALPVHRTSRAIERLFDRSGKRGVRLIQLNEFTGFPMFTPRAHIPPPP